MAEYCLKIGDIRLNISGDATAERLLTFPGMSTFLCSSGLPQGSVVTDVAIDYRNFAATYTNDGEMLSFQFGTADVLIADALRPALLLRFASGNVMAMPLHDEPHLFLTAMPDDEFRFALWMATSLVGLRCGSLPVHASTILCQGRAVLFLGESGTGKSTHTRLWLNTIPHCRLLNDDSPFLHAASCTLFGSPWSGKTHCYVNESAPLAAIVRLQQAPENKMERLPALKAFAALQPSLPPAFFTVDHCRESILAFVSRVVGQVPVYHLACLPDADAARLAFNTIFSKPLNA